jgi:uncharacterized RDD family membrane protein YckC
MHSAEPFDRRSVNDPSQPAPTAGAWRAEVASRVSSYRARRQSGSGEEDSIALDFGAAPEAQGSSGDVPSRAATPAGNAAHKAFDTRYYRRLNAQSLSAMTVGAAAATAQPETEDGYEAENRIAIAAAIDNEPDPQEAASLAIDLELHPAAVGDAALERYLISDAGPETLFEPERAPSMTAPVDAAPSVAPALPPPGNLIAFPRPLMEPPLLQQPSRDELADPVHRRPRILEVPEDIMPAVQGSLFPEIRLDADELESCASREPEIEVPLQVAPLPARLMASLTDVAVVAAAGALFAAIACRALPEVPHTKPFWMSLGVVTMLLWAIYQQMFLLYAGRTVGMCMRGIHLSTFDGRTPEWTERRRRARFVLISFASVALGFFWALVDEDTLCWHDRVSRTFPTLD